MTAANNSGQQVGYKSKQLTVFRADLNRNVHIKLTDNEKLSLETEKKGCPYGRGMVSNLSL